MFQPLKTAGGQVVVGEVVVGLLGNAFIGRRSHDSLLASHPYMAGPHTRVYISSMTRSEYQELVGFLGPKFDAIEERLTRVEVSVEENRHHIQLLAEGITAVDRKLDRFREETAEGFASVWSELGNVRREMAQGFQAQGRLLN